MSRAIRILQEDCLRNNKRLDKAREVVELLINQYEKGDPLKDVFDEVYKLEKLLRNTGKPE